MCQKKKGKKQKFLWDHPQRKSALLAFFNEPYWVIQKDLKISGSFYLFNIIHS